MRYRRFVALAATVPLLISAASAGQRDVAHFLGTLVDLDRLAVLEEGVTCKQFSSYDRASRYDAETDEYVNWGANGDRGHYLRVEPDGEAVMAEMDGPGCIVRIWSANPTGTIRFYLDGAEEPTFEWPFADLFRNKISPFQPPIAGMHGRGANSYFPIPYAKSCKVTADKAHGQYYHIGYKTFPKDTPVKTLSLPLSQAQTQVLDEVLRAWKNCGVSEAIDAKAHEREVPAGEEATLVELDGPATITAFRARLVSDEPRALRRVLLRMYWDREKRPSVECPLGDFFGTGYYANPYQSLPLGMGPDGGYCFWRMPFRKSGRIVAVNQGTQPVTLHYSVAARPGKLAPRTAYFHARWRREAPCKTFDYPILDTKRSAGRYLGCCLSVDNPRTGWWGEGDEKVYVDGETFPSTFGTGSEDYFGDAWGFRHFVHPVHGCTLGQGPGFSNKWSVYRWHVSDEIPWTESFRITIENYGRDKDYSSVAYWYQLRPQTDFFEPVPVQERLPRPRRIPGAIEAESLEGTGGEVVASQGRLDTLSGGKGLLLEGKRGESFDLTVPVPADDVYGVLLYSLRGEAHAAFELRKGETVIGRGEKAFQREARFTAGKVRLSKGESTLSLKLLADGSLLLDALRLEPSRKKRGVLEGENLEVMAASGPKPEREDVRLSWSGDSQLLFPAKEAGQSITFAVPAKAPGRFVLSARLTRGPDYGRVQAFHAGEPVGEVVDCYAPNPSVGREVQLGKLQLSPDGQAVAFKIVGKHDKAAGYRLGIDYLSLHREVVANAIEAEKLPRVEVEGGPIGPQAMGGWGGHNWSGGTQLFFRPRDKGASVTLEVAVPKAGRYALAVYYTKAIDYGIVQLKLDGKPIGKPFDGFHNGVIPSGKVSYGTLDLAQGKHRLTFQVTGKNDAATGHFVGIDCITLDPAD
ncbi:MAG: DUF2961 domain-containing protein [Planctomycetota bacterium]